MKMVVLEEKFYGFCFSLPSHEKCVLSGFVRSGYMTLNDGALRDSHYGGRSWSQSAGGYSSGKSARAHGFHINATTFFPSTDFNRSNDSSGRLTGRHRRHLRRGRKL